MDRQLLDQILARISHYVDAKLFGRNLSAPVLTNPLIFDALAEWDKRSDLADFGVEVSGKPGKDCRIVIGRRSHIPPVRTRIELFGQPDQLVVLSDGHLLAGTIRLESARQTVLVGSGGSRPFHAQTLIIRGQGASVLIGAGSTSNGCNLLVDGDDTYIIICDDCMFAHGIEISATDSHAIVDARSLEVLNLPESVIIGKHVWIGSHVSVSKGTRIGDGCVVGTRSFVTGQVAPLTLVVGAPARVLRSGVTWTREREPSIAAREAAIRSCS